MVVTAWFSLSPRKTIDPDAGLVRSGSGHGHGVIELLNPFQATEQEILDQSNNEDANGHNGK